MPGLLGQDRAKSPSTSSDNNVYLALIGADCFKVTSKYFFDGGHASGLLKIMAAPSAQMVVTAAWGGLELLILLLCKITNRGWPATPQLNFPSLEESALLCFPLRSLMMFNTVRFALSISSPEWLTISTSCPMRDSNSRPAGT